jgi:hypothetical protein
MSRRGFTKVSNATLDAWSAGLSASEFKVAVYLLSLEWGGRPAKASVRTAARRLGMHVETAHAAISSLTSRGVVAVETAGAGRAANSYRVDQNPDLAPPQRDTKVFHRGPLCSENPNTSCTENPNANIRKIRTLATENPNAIASYKTHEDSKKEGKEGIPAVVNSADSFRPNDPLATVYTCCRCGGRITAKEAADESLTDATEHGYQHVLCLTSPS